MELINIKRNESLRVILLWFRNNCSFPSCYYIKKLKNNFELNICIPCTSAVSLLLKDLQELKESCLLGIVFKKLLKMTKSHTGVTGFQSELHFLFQLLTKVHPWKKCMTRQVVRSVSLMWETQIELWSPVLALLDHIIISFF